MALDNRCQKLKMDVWSDRWSMKTYWYIFKHFSFILRLKPKNILMCFTVACKGSVLGCILTCVWSICVSVWFWEIYFILSGCGWVRLYTISTAVRYLFTVYAPFPVTGQQIRNNLFVWYCKESLQCCSLALPVSLLLKCNQKLCVQLIWRSPFFLKTF